MTDIELYHHFRCTSPKGETRITKVLDGSPFVDYVRHLKPPWQVEYLGLFAGPPLSIEDIVARKLEQP